LGVTGLSKVYDGSTAMSNITAANSASAFLTNDRVTVNANGLFGDQNVGTNKTYTIAVTFGGLDAANYTLSGGGINTGKRRGSGK